MTPTRWKYLGGGVGFFVLVLCFHGMVSEAIELVGYGLVAAGVGTMIEPIP